MTFCIFKLGTTRPICNTLVLLSSEKSPFSLPEAPDRLRSAHIPETYPSLIASKQ